MDTNGNWHKGDHVITIGKIADGYAPVEALVETVRNGSLVLRLNRRDRIGLDPSEIVAYDDVLFERLVTAAAEITEDNERIMAARREINHEFVGLLLDS